MAKPLTPAMRARLIMAYDHAGDLLREGFTHLAIIRALERSNGARFGYCNGTQRLRCGGITVLDFTGNPRAMLDAWMRKAAQFLDERAAA